MSTLLHTEVRWLAKRNCLDRFLLVIILFLKKESVLENDLKERKHDIAYFSDLDGKFNVLQKLLQGNTLNLVYVNVKLTSFRNKL